MNPDDQTYQEFVESVVECVEEVAEQHGIEAEVTTEEGEIAIVSVRGELEEGKPVELSTAISSDLKQNLVPIAEQVGVNEKVDFPEAEAIRPKLTTGGRVGDDGGPFEESLETERVVRAAKPLRTAEEIEHECDRLSE